MIVTGRGGLRRRDFHIFIDSWLTDGGEVSLTRRPPFTRRKFLVLFFERVRCGNSVIFLFYALYCQSFFLNIYPKVGTGIGQSV
jgi:hypothetical protein